LAIHKYIGNAISKNQRLFIAKKLVEALKNHVIYAITDSDFGCFRDFIIVGNAAAQSLAIAKIIAIIGFFVMYRSINANKEKAQQI
jgi:hypothetical protein